MSAAATRQATLDGFVHPDFVAVATVFRDLVRCGPGGGGVCVYHRGECVVDLWGGFRDGNGHPWTRDTMAPSFSTTKGVASTLLHIAVDRGLLDYDDRVADHWPEFAQAGKQAITVRQVLAHQSGLYHIRQMIDHADRMLDWRFMIHAIERTAPIHKPGARTGYHGLTYGFLVGELLQRVTHKTFSRLVREDLAEPLGLDGMYIGAPEDALPRSARLLWSHPGVFGWRPPIGPHAIPEGLLRGVAGLQSAIGLIGVRLDLLSIVDALAPRGISSFDFGAERTLRSAIPAANGLFTARSLARMYAALANGGEIDGTRLLSARTLARAIQRQGPTRRRVVIPFDMRWRLGYHGVATTRGIPQQAFGHFGMGGSGAWADPRRNLAVGLIVNGGVGTPFGDSRILRVGGAALASANRRTARAGRGWTPLRPPELLAAALDALAWY